MRGSVVNGAVCCTGAETSPTPGPTTKDHLEALCTVIHVGGFGGPFPDSAFGTVRARTGWQWMWNGPLVTHSVTDAGWGWTKGQLWADLDLGHGGKINEKPDFRLEDISPWLVLKPLFG